MVRGLLVLTDSCLCKLHSLQGLRREVWLEGGRPLLGMHDADAVQINTKLISLTRP